MEELFQRLKKLRIAVVGDIIADKYIYGVVERISPEAPVPIFEIKRSEYRAGGASNVALNLKGLGVGEVLLCGILGKDKEGEILKEIIEEKGVELTAFYDGRPTTRKTRLIARSQQILRIDREERESISKEISKKIFQVIKDFRPNAIIVSDYAKGVITKDLMENLKQYNISPLFIDPRPKNFFLYKGAFCITPNEKEFKEMCKLLGIVDTNHAEKEFVKKMEIEHLILTLGEKGIKHFSKKGEEGHFPAIAKEVYDVTGAGDTVIATISALVTAGIDWSVACQMANLAASIVITKLGTAYITQEELIRSLKEINFPNRRMIINDEQ